MTENDRINEELRNYKLFKIQRMNVKEQQFKTFTAELQHIRKFEILNYILCTLHAVIIGLLVYQTISALWNVNYLRNHLLEILLTLLGIVVFGIFHLIVIVRYNLKLKKYITETDNAARYFAQESEILKSNYEQYVDLYLQNNRRK